MNVSPTFQNYQVENAKNEALIEFYCKICSKSFSSRNSYENHVQSKKHKDQESKATKDEDKIVQSPVKIAKIPKSPTTQEVNLEAAKIVEEPMEEDAKNWEEIAENEDIEIGEYNHLVDIFTKNLRLNNCICFFLR